MLSLLSILATLVSVQAEQDLARHTYPLAKPLPAPRITLDVSAYPEGKAWGEAAVKVARSWYPTLTALLATDGFQPRPVKIEIKPNIGPPAYASGGTITVKAEWIRDHPEDLGVLIHELTHVIQAYPGSERTPGWLVEGVADYIRYYRYEPEAPRPRVNKATASYRDAYGTTAAFLAWASREYDMRLVPALDGAMRRKEDPLPVFEKFTRKNVDALWAEFVKTLP